jgi:hypothetical protein
VRLGRKREQAKTEAVIQLARLYQAFRNELPTRGDKRGLTRFERFLEAALGDLTGNTGTALARRWRRYEAKNAAGQNGVCLPPAAA